MTVSTFGEVPWLPDISIQAVCSERFHVPQSPKIVHLQHSIAPLLSLQLFRRVVCSLVLRPLDHCSFVRSTASDSRPEELQEAQNKAASPVLDCCPRSCVTEVHECLTWQRLKDRVSANALMYFHRIINTQTPTFLYNNINYCTNTHSCYIRGADSGWTASPWRLTLWSGQDSLCQWHFGTVLQMRFGKFLKGD